MKKFMAALVLAAIAFLVVSSAVAEKQATIVPPLPDSITKKL
ncbi:hypothetical protein [Tumebacillus flagellatus]|nr:hypothetical protein [Tumebacillus flagellatus]